MFEATPQSCLLYADVDFKMDGPVTKTVTKKQLQHRWGSSKLYRSYYADYRTFISRPEIVAAKIGERSGTKVVIVQSDLSKFYDRVRPALRRDRWGHTTYWQTRVDGQVKQGVWAE